MNRLVSMNKLIHGEIPKTDNPDWLFEYEWSYQKHGKSYQVIEKQCVFDSAVKIVKIGEREYDGGFTGSALACEKFINQKLENYRGEATPVGCCAAIEAPWLWFNG